MKARRIVGSSLVAGVTVALVATLPTRPATASDLNHDPLLEIRAGTSVQVDLTSVVELDPTVQRTWSVAPATEHGSASLDGTVVTYSPDPGFTGSDQIAVTDHQTFGSSTFGLSVRVEDQPLIAADDFTLFDVDQPITLDVSANDSSSNGDPVRITLAGTGGGTASCDGPSCTFTPAPGSRGGYVQYDAWDDTTGDHDSGTWRLEARDRAPVTVDDAIVVHRGQSTTFSPLANDSDPDGDSLSLDWALGPPDCQWATGECTVSAATDEQWTEPHQLAYSVTDGIQHTVGHITATMPADDNAPPQSQPAYVTALGTRPVQVSPFATDPNGDPLTWTPLDQPTHGQLSQDADGWWYVADDNADGTDGFTMRIADDHGGVTEEPVTIERTAYTTPSFTPVWQQPTLVYRGEPVGVLGACTTDGQTYGTDPTVVLQSDDGSGWATRTELSQSEIGGRCALGGYYYARTSGLFQLRTKVLGRWGSASQASAPRTLKVALAKITAVDPVGAESITVRNNGEVAFNLSAFRLSSRPDPYTGKGDRSARLPSYVLKAGQSVVLHTGSGTSTATDLYLGVGRMLPDAGGTVSLGLHGRGPTARW